MSVDIWELIRCNALQNTTLGIMDVLCLGVAPITVAHLCKGVWVIDRLSPDMHIGRPLLYIIEHF